MKRERDDDDSRLFREAVRGVKPLISDRHPARPAPPRVRLASRQTAVPDTPPVDTGEAPQAGDEVLSYRRPGIQESVLRRLRRGRYRVEAEIDLHGLTISQAKRTLNAFLAQAAARRLRCVRIVHGKGLRPGSRGPVLRQAVGSMLRRKSIVLAYAPTPDAAGGTGAVHVLLAG